MRVDSDIIAPAFNSDDAPDFLPAIYLDLRLMRRG
jgi:hypothetical protein